jgi:omega-6 fatty acid desaturase (delta-12 desaturase)
VPPSPHLPLQALKNWRPLLKPFQQLPNYHLEACANEHPILNRYVTTMGFRDSLRCVQHKLWHPAEQRMVTFHEHRRLQDALPAS